MSGVIAALASKPAISGADVLLAGETQGLAIDATASNGLGYVSIKDTGTPANSKSNVAINTLFANASGFPKQVRNSSGVRNWTKHNFWPYSDDASQFNGGYNSGVSVTANSVADPDGAMVADTVAITGSGYAYWRTPAIQTGLVVCASMWIKADAPVTLNLRQIGAAPGATSISVTTSWQQFFIAATGAGAEINIGIDPRGTQGGDGQAKTFYICRRQVTIGSTPSSYYAPTSSSVFADIPIDFLSGQAAFLSESAATNYLLNSSAPATQTVSLASGTYTLWVEGSGSCILSGGPTGTASAGTPATFTLAGTTSVTFTVSGSLTLFQCENSPCPTSYIPTAGNSIARPKDAISVLTSAFPYSSAQSSIYADFEVDTGASGSVSDVFELYADTNNRMVAFVNSGVPQFAQVIAGASTTVTAGISTPGFDAQWACAVASGDMATSYQGGLVRTASPSAGTISATKLSIGAATTGVTGFYGRIKKFLYVPRRVSNSDLPTW